MALTPTENEAFLREVDDNLRRDQMTGLARKWGTVGAVVVGLFLMGLAAFLWWRNHQLEQAGKEGEQFVQVLAAADVGSASPTATPDTSPPAADDIVPSGLLVP